METVKHEFILNDIAVVPMGSKIPHGEEINKKRAMRHMVLFDMARELYLFLALVNFRLLNS